MKWSADNYFLTWWKRIWQNYFYDIYMLRMIFNCCGDIVYFKIKPVDVSPLFPVAKIKIGAVINKQLLTESGFIIFIGVGPKMKPDEINGIRGIIDIGEFFKTICCVFFIIQGNVDGIIDLLLPILREGCELRDMRYEQEENEFSQRMEFDSKIK